MIAKIRNYIFTGFIIVLPLIISVTVAVWLFKMITNGMVKLFPIVIKENLFLQVSVRIISLIIFITALIIIGMFARVIFIKKIFVFGEKLLFKIPLFSKVYISIKQISNGVLGKEKTKFNRVVLIEYPRKGLYSLGFVTVETQQNLQDVIRKQNGLNVFVPTSPNPTGGMLIFVSKNEVVDINISIEDALKFVISAGTMPLR